MTFVHVLKQNISHLNALLVCYASGVISIEIVTYKRENHKFPKWVHAEKKTNKNQTSLPSISPPEEAIFARFRYVVPMASFPVKRSLQSHRHNTSFDCDSVKYEPLWPGGLQKQKGRKYFQTFISYQSVSTPLTWPHSSNLALDAHFLLPLLVATRQCSKINKYITFMISAECFCQQDPLVAKEEGRGPALPCTDHSD